MCLGKENVLDWDEYWFAKREADGLDKLENVRLRISVSWFDFELYLHRKETWCLKKRTAGTFEFVDRIFSSAYLNLLSH